MMKIRKSTLASLLMLLLLLASCSTEEPIIPNEEELITTLSYTLTPTGGGASVIFTFQDIDGDGGDNPTITNGTLAANTTYNGTLDLLNESVSPIESITSEVREEGVDHQFFFVSTIDGMTVTYNDMDSNGDVLGLESELTTNAASSGTLTVILRHEPNKAASGVSDGLISNAGGETDIEVTFDVVIQ